MARQRAAYRPRTSSRSALIAGGGIGGLAAALCLAKVGVEVVVAEQAETFAELGAGIQLSPNATRVLHHLGLTEALGACASSPTASEFRHWRSGGVAARQPLGEAARRAYGHPYWHVLRGDLLRVLAQAAAESSRIELRLGARLCRFGQEGEEVVAALATRGGEATHRCAVLVGADGIHSTVRTALFGQEEPTFRGQVAWRAVVPAERLPRDLRRPVATVWWGPRRHFVRYPVRDGALVNCVCVVEAGMEEGAWRQESWTRPGEHAELKADFAGWHEDVLTLIDHMDEGALFKWALHDRPPLPRWSEGATTLLGDACHPMLPFLAQGAAMAIEDGAVLADCLAAGGDVATRLARYQRLRRRRAAWVQRRSRANGRIFHLSGAAAWLRDRVANRAAARMTDRIYRYDAARPRGRD